MRKSQKFGKIIKTGVVGNIRGEVLYEIPQLLSDCHGL